MKAIIVFSSVAMLLSMLAGCAKTVNAVEVNENGSYRWVKTDPDLGSTAAVQDVKRTSENGVLHIQVVVANQNSNEGEFLYRFVWMDAGNMEVPTPLTNWQRQTILGKQTLTLMGVSPDPRITHARLEMKRPEN